jgi:hypothetical protein
VTGDFLGGRLELLPAVGDLGELAARQLVEIPLGRVHRIQSILHVFATPDNHFGPPFFLHRIALKFEGLGLCLHERLPLDQHPIAEQIPADRRLRQCGNVEQSILGVDSGIGDDVADVLGVSGVTVHLFPYF